MSFGRVVLPSSVSGTVKKSCKSLVDIVLDVEQMRAKRIKIQEGVEEFLYPVSVGFAAG